MARFASYILGIGATETILTAAVPSAPFAAPQLREAGTRVGSQWFSFRAIDTTVRIPYFRGHVAPGTPV